jgi:hypothetical protein
MRLLPSTPALPPDSEPFEWPVIPDEFGDRMPDIDAFVDWCIEMDLLGFRSVSVLHANHDAFSRLTGRQQLSKRRLTRLVTLSDRIESWRDRRHDNATRYRIHRVVMPSSQAIAA